MIQNSHLAPAGISHLPGPASPALLPPSNGAPHLHIDHLSCVFHLFYSATHPKYVGQGVGVRYITHTSYRDNDSNQRESQGIGNVA